MYNKKEEVATRVAVCVGILLAKITAKRITRDEQTEEDKRRYAIR